MQIIFPTDLICKAPGHKKLWTGEHLLPAFATDTRPGAGFSCTPGHYRTCGHRYLCRDRAPSAGQSKTTIHGFVTGGLPAQLRACLAAGTAKTPAVTSVSNQAQLPGGIRSISGVVAADRAALGRGECRGFSPRQRPKHAVTCRPGSDAPGGARKRGVSPLGSSQPAI